MAEYIDEILLRQPAFQPGMEIRLADQQLWCFPTGEGMPRLLSNALDREYHSLLRVHREAEDRAERTLAELSLAIFLIGLNYRLDATELETLFSFAPGSPGLAEAQSAFRDLARDHLRRFQLAAPEFAEEPEGNGSRPGLWARALSWLRQILTARRSCLTAPDGEASLSS